MLLTECYQKLSPWLCMPLSRTGRSYLEAHLDLLTDECARFLESFISEYNDCSCERQRLCILLRLLQESSVRGGTAQAVREAYINAFGGFILDLPAWLTEVEHQLVGVSALNQTDRLITVNKARLKDAVSHALCERLAPEIVAELRYQLGMLFINAIVRHSTGAFETAIVCYEESLQIYTLANYPLQYAKIQLALGDVHRRLATDTEAGCRRFL